MKSFLWVVAVVAVALAGSWGYDTLLQQENDKTQRVRLLAVAEEQRLDLAFSRSGKLVTRVPEEGETVKAGELVARIEEPGLTEDAADLERQRQQIAARDRTRLEEIAVLRAQLAETAAEEKRVSRLVIQGIAPSADLETLRHRREAAEASIRARESEKGELQATDESLRSRREKIQRFVEEGTLLAPTDGTVLSRQHRRGEQVAANDPVVTLQIEAPYLRVEVPEERLSAFAVGKLVRARPQARPDAPFSARVISIKPRAEFATRKNWGLRSRDLKTFSVRLAPLGVRVISGQTFVVEAGND
jgi:HlyD family secretion protein